ncbi:hypothetical protein FSC37_09205 [Piscinibacter aquaticus]|uniref:Uncharacterized protein n=1 Tax=Piscinibacter aquaticus TaxID=392597 RepID=A0A5C6U2N8_9BURK|nr:hypothetical protein FSC37_09205 [Piscinibacter aquaticus]
MDETDIADRIRAMAADGEAQPIVEKPGFTDYLSGAFQNALSLGQTYLTRRMDIELQTQLAGAQAQVQRITNQRPVNDHAFVTPQYGVPGGIGGGMGNMLPLIIGGIALLTVAAFALKRG